MTCATNERTGIRVLRAGPLATLQDAGRFGARHLGITQGGAADQHAWAWANQLAGNPWGTGALEITFGGLELEAETDLWIAVTGADLGAAIGGRPLPRWQSVEWKAGERLVFKTPINGLRAYLAVAGGFEAEAVLGSVASVGRESLGGFDGQGSALAAGDRLVVANRLSAMDHKPRQAPTDVIPDYRETATLALIPGAQIAEFTGRSLYDAFNAEWQVDTRADRMGVRLLGPKLHCNLTSMVSEGINLGSVQVPPDGQPIALLNDRQTIGGYPRLGALSPLAVSRLAQCMPGQNVRLMAQGSDRALREYRAFRESFMAAQPDHT